MYVRQRCVGGEQAADSLSTVEPERSEEAAGAGGRTGETDRDGGRDELRPSQIEDVRGMSIELAVAECLEPLERAVLVCRREGGRKAIGEAVRDGSSLVRASLKGESLVQNGRQRREGGDVQRDGRLAPGSGRLARASAPTLSGREHGQIMQADRT